MRDPAPSISKADIPAAIPIATPTTSSRHRSVPVGAASAHNPNPPTRGTSKSLPHHRVTRDGSVYEHITVDEQDVEEIKPNRDDPDAVSLSQPPSFDPSKPSRVLLFVKGYTVAEALYNSSVATLSGQSNTASVYSQMTLGASLTTAVSLVLAGSQATTIPVGGVVVPQGATAPRRVSRATNPRGTWGERFSSVGVFLGNSSTAISDLGDILLTARLMLPNAEGLCRKVEMSDYGLVVFVLCGPLLTMTLQSFSIAYGWKDVGYILRRRLSSQNGVGQGVVPLVFAFALRQLVDEMYFSVLIVAALLALVVWRVGGRMAIGKVRKAVVESTAMGGTPKSILRNVLNTLVLTTEHGVAMDPAKPNPAGSSQDKTQGGTTSAPSIPEVAAPAFTTTTSTPQGLNPGTWDKKMLAAVLLGFSTVVLSMGFPMLMMTMPMAVDDMLTGDYENDTASANAMENDMVCYQSQTFLVYALYNIGPFAIFGFWYVVFSVVLGKSEWELRLSEYSEYVDGVRSSGFLL